MERFYSRILGTVRRRILHGENGRTLTFAFDKATRREVKAVSGEIKDCIESEERGPLREHFKNGKWSIYGSGLDSYMETFSRLSTKEEVIRGLDERRSQGNDVYVLDCMGEGTVVRELGEHISGGMFITLCDLRTPQQKVFDEEHHITPIVGNVLSRDTWQEIRRAVKRTCTEDGFDVIFCRPEGALNYAFESIKPHLAVFQQLIKLLNGDGGALFTEIPSVVSDNTLRMHRWADSILRLPPGDSIEVRIERTDSSHCSFVLGVTKYGQVRRIPLIDGNISSTIQV